MRRLNRMFGAISATNEAILRAKTEQELYQRVCDAAVHSGKVRGHGGPAGGAGLDLVEAGRRDRRRSSNRSCRRRSRSTPATLWNGRLRQGIPNAAAGRQ